MVVSVEELFHKIWKDEYYSKNSSTITVHIRHIREKLSDTGEKPKYIKTVWGIGYKIWKEFYEHKAIKLARNRYSILFSAVCAFPGPVGFAQLGPFSNETGKDHRL